MTFSQIIWEVSILWTLFGTNDGINLFLSVAFKMFLLAYTSFLYNIVSPHDSPGSSSSCLLAFRMNKYPSFT